MEKKNYTVILVPHAQAKFRKFQVSGLQVRLATAVLVALGVSSAYVTWSYLTTPIDEEQVEHLRQENLKLKEINLSFEQDIRHLQSDLETYEERTRQLAIVAGLDSVAGRESGLGGAITAEELSPDGTVLIRGRLVRLADDLNLVEESFEERLRWMSSVPAVSPVRGLFTSPYGTRQDPITGRRAFHQGVDISAAPGRAVVASADGIVVRSGRIGPLGNAVYISHGYGLTTRYGHLSKLAVEPGQEIERGDVVGYVGNTGRSTGYHLHYEVRRDGKPVNPLGYILDRATRGP